MQNLPRAALALFAISSDLFICVDELVKVALLQLETDIIY
jgi:hypothetical protein